MLIIEDRDHVSMMASKQRLKSDISEIEGQGEEEGVCLFARVSECGIDGLSQIKAHHPAARENEQRSDDENEGDKDGIDRYLTHSI